MAVVISSWRLKKVEGDTKHPGNKTLHSHTNSPVRPALTNKKYVGQGKLARKNSKLLKAFRSFNFLRASQDCITYFLFVKAKMHGLLNQISIIYSFSSEVGCDRKLLSPLQI